jgi:hypothetical protein
MAEALRSEPPSEGIEGLREAGIPVRESAGKAPHEVVSDLADVVPGNHPDAETIKALMSCGAALTGDQVHEVNALSAKHAALLAQDDSDEVRESMRVLRETGVPTRGGLVQREADPEQDDSPTLTPAAALLASGVPLKDAG